MSGLTSAPQITNLDPYSISQYPEQKLGIKVVDQYGDAWRYSQIGASNAVAGQIQGAPVQKTNHHNVAAYAAAAVGAKQVTLTLGATAAVANEYAGGYLVANDNAPEGVYFRIKSHPAADASGNLTVTLEEPLVEAVTTSSEFTLVHNAWNGVIVGTAVTVRAAGVPIVDATAAYYAWLKTRGVCPVLIGSAATLGADLIIGGTAGSVTDRTDALGASAEPVVAVADIVLGVTGEYNPVRLVID